MAVRDFDEDRVLCVDGGCIGLVGSNGQCRACGLAGPRSSATSTVSDTDDGGSANSRDGETFDDDKSSDDGDELANDESDGDEFESDDESESEQSAVANAAMLDDDFDARQLCRDGACVGLIGPSGVCGICGLGSEEE